MIATRKSLLALTAADLMKRHVIQFPQDLPLRQAVDLLLREQIGGAPVVDGEGKCVGVFSTVDVARLALNQPAALGLVRPPQGMESHRVLFDWQVVPPEEFATEEVRRFMTADPVCVSPDTPIATVARMLIDAHIHRVIVADADNKPVGIVTTTDLLAALVHAAAR
jgi:CBS domain-containing protein